MNGHPGLSKNASGFQTREGDTRLAPPGALRACTRVLETTRIAQRWVRFGCHRYRPREGCGHSPRLRALLGHEFLCLYARRVEQRIRGVNASRPAVEQETPGSARTVVAEAERSRLAPANRAEAERSEARAETQSQQTQSVFGWGLQDSFQRSGSHSNATFTGTDDDDDFTVRETADGRLIVRDNRTGVEREGPTGSEGAVTFNLGAGNDTITIDRSVRSPSRLIVRGGAGNDRLDGTEAQVVLTLDGEQGDDFLAGGARGDRLIGGDGNDHLRGHGGADELDGGGDGDVLIGGAGADSLDGGRGVDTLYARAEDASVVGGDDGAVDLVVAERGTSVTAGSEDSVAYYDPESVDAFLREHPEFEIVGTDAFSERVRADIGVMLATDGLSGLVTEVGAKLKEDGRTLQIIESYANTYGGSVNLENFVSYMQEADTHRYSFTSFVHELVHEYQRHISGEPEGATEFSSHVERTEPGSGYFPDGVVSNLELQAVGVPFLTRSGERGPDLPFSENVAREALGLPRRRHYSVERGPPKAFWEFLD